MSIIVKGGASSNLAAVNASGELAVGLPANPASAGYVKIAGPTGTPLVFSDDGYLFTGQDTMLFSDQVDGAAINTNLWSAVNTTLVTALASGFIQLNSTGLTTANGAAQVSSVKHFTLNGGQPIVVAFTATINVGAQANATMEMGIGLASGVTAPTDGVFFRFGANGNLSGVLNYGGVETLSADIATPSVNDAHEYVVLISNSHVMFVIDRVPVATVYKPTGQPFPTSTTRMPIYARVYNGASAPATAPRLHLGQVLVTQLIVNTNRSWPITLAAMGRGAHQSPVTTFAQTSNFANSTAPASATLANTTAGYATLGGKYQFAAVAGAATDYALFAYQVPTGYQLHITRVDITCVNTGAAVATTATILDWGLGLNSSAVSLATVDGAGTWAPRRRAMGQQGWEINAGIGKIGDELANTYDPPLVVDGGRYFHVILQVPVGTATASQVMRGSVSINGYFE